MPGGRWEGIRGGTVVKNHCRGVKKSMKRSLVVALCVLGAFSAADGQPSMELASTAFLDTTFSAMPTSTGCRRTLPRRLFKPSRTGGRMRYRLKEPQA